MAAQQSVKLETNLKKIKYSKKVDSAKAIVNEGPTISGKKSNLGSESSIKNYENNNVCSSLLPTGLNEKKNKDKFIGKEAILLKNVKELDENIKNDTISCNLNKSSLQKQCVHDSTEVDASVTSKGLSKSKKRRLRKQKLQRASASPFSESTSNIQTPSIVQCKDNVSEIVEKTCDTEDKKFIEIKKSTKDPIQDLVPSENFVLKNSTALINFADHSGKIFTADSEEACVLNSNVSSSINEKTHSDEVKAKLEAQDVTARNFNDLLNVMKSLNTNDENLPKSCSSICSSDKQCSVEVKKPTLESDLNLIGKIKDFSETFSKLQFVEKLLSNSALDQVSGDRVDGNISQYKTEIKDLTSSLLVDDSCGVLQVNDNSNTFAETNCEKIEVSGDTLYPVNKKMDANADNADKSASIIKKSREEVKAEREAKKAAKLMAKKAKTSGVKILPDKSSDAVDGCIDIKNPFSSVGSIGEKEEKSKLEKQLCNSTVEANLKINQDIQPLLSDNTEPIGKTKAELRAERRQKQDAQRAAKASQKESAKQLPKNDLTIEKKTEKCVDNVLKEIEKPVSEEIIGKSKYKVKLFSHLYLEKETFQNYDCCTIHPAILQLGAQYEARVISGSNARCLALLHTLKRMISDYSTPLKQEFSRGLESMLAKSMDYLNYCRPSSVSMTNAVRHIKRHLTQLPNTIPDSEARQKLYDVIETYIREQIDVAGEAICNTVQKKINDGDVILTYGCSSLIYRILLESHRSGTKFSVVIVDAGPWFEGREMLRRLVREGVKCCYILITAASFIMREVSKVLLGAHALLANGYVMSRAGTSQVALLAHSYNVPVLVCCETHKFSERVQTDAFVYNELGDPDEFVSKTTGPLSHWRSYDYLTPLSIAFDVTPPDLVTAVVTELGILPCTSVPVILRIKPSETV